MATTDYPVVRAAPAETFSLVSILSVVAAVGAFWVASGILSLLLALCAILFGVLGLVFAISPARRGGIVSMLSVFLGVIGIVAAIVKLAGNIL